MRDPGKEQHRGEIVQWFDGMRVAGCSDDMLGALETDILPRYLVQRRWYGAKDAGLPRVRFEQLIPLGAAHEAARLGILEVEPPGQRSQRYLLPLILKWGDAGRGTAPIAAVVRDGIHGALLDACFADEFVYDLLRAIADDNLEHVVCDRRVLARGTAALRACGDLTAMAIERSTVEQSNTSIRVGQMAMLKFVRKLETGTHPELEMSRFLTEVSHFENTPALLGSIELASDTGNTTTLCVLVALIPNSGDGWSYVLEQLAGALRNPGEAMLPQPLLVLARRLGQRTAELHHALADAGDEPAFQPESTSTSDLERWAAAIRQMAQTAIAALERHLAAISSSSRDGGRLLTRRDELMSHITGLIPRSLRVMRTRLHGDYHLGQVLVTGTDVFIIDFEGEPLRPLAERRAKHSPLRDVAGMLRSFAYTSAATQRNLREQGVDDEAETQLASWSADMSGEFLDSYRTAIRGCAGYPDSEYDANRLLRLFLLEKALYEIAYEAANRPDWIDIPIAGALALLDQE